MLGGSLHDRLISYSLTEGEAAELAENLQIIESTFNKHEKDLIEKGK